MLKTLSTFERNSDKFSKPLVICIVGVCDMKEAISRGGGADSMTARETAFQIARVGGESCSQERLGTIGVELVGIN